MTLDLHHVQARLSDFRRELDLHPLASFRCWERIPVEGEEVDPERFSQVDTVRALQHHRTVIVWGGSRSGKTAGMMAATIALALGSDHPDARAFWAINGCDPDLFPTGPGQVWLVALTSNDSLQYHRRQVVELLPRTGPEHPGAEVRGQPWHDWGIDAKGQSRIDVMVPGHASPARIVFKSEVPGEDAAKGDRCRAILHDEEGKTSEFFDEAEKRLWDQDGWQILCNAPTKKGKRWAWHRFVGQRQERTWVGWLWATDNPHISQARVRAQTGRADALIRTKGKFVDPEGTVFPWSPSRHVVAGLAALIPADWSRYRAIDWGFRDPFCCLWMTWCRAPILVPDGRVIHDGSVLAYRERYVAEVTLPVHANAIRVAEGWIKGADGAWARGPATERVAGGWADTEAPGNIALFNELGLLTWDANKGREAGVALLQQLLEGDSAGPRFYVDASCVQLIAQIPAARYTDQTREAIERGADHAIDPARYGVMGLVEMFGAKQAAKAVNDGMRKMFTRIRR